MQESSCNCGRNIDFKELSFDLQKDLLQKTTEVEKLTEALKNQETKSSESSLLIATLTDKLKAIELENEKLKTENEHLDKENDEQADEYVETRKALEKECERYKKILKKYSDDHNEKLFKSEIQNNMSKFKQFTDIKSLSPYLMEFKLMTQSEYVDIEEQHKDAMYYYTVVLPKKGLNAHRTFYQCLKKAVEDLDCNSGHKDLLKILDSVIKS